MKNYKKPYSKNRRSSKERRSTSDESLVSKILSACLRQITPDLKRFLSNIAVSEMRIADARERQIQASTEIMDLLKSADPSGSKPKKSPKVLNEHKKKVLKIIAEQRAKGETFDRIADRLNESGTVTFSGRGKWHAQTVHRLFIDHILSEQD